MPMEGGGERTSGCLVPRCWLRLNHDNSITGKQLAKDVVDAPSIWVHSETGKAPEKKSIVGYLIGKPQQAQENPKA